MFTSKYFVLTSATCRTLHPHAVTNGANSGNVDNSGCIGSIIGLVGDLLAWNQTQ